jgi:hypothetical protein
MRNGSGWCCVPPYLISDRQTSTKPKVFTILHGRLIDSRVMTRRSPEKGRDDQRSRNIGPIEYSAERREFYAFDPASGQAVSSRA